MSEHRTPSADRDIPYPDYPLRRLRGSFADPDARGDRRHDHEPLDGTARLLLAIESLGCDHGALAAAAALIHQLDLAARERLLVTNQGSSHVEAA